MLDQIDKVLEKGVFDGTWDMIKPSYAYKRDPLLQKGVRKKKYFNVNDIIIKERMKGLGPFMYGHDGSLITMNGSKYKNFEHMQEIRRQSEQSQIKF